MKVLKAIPTLIYVVIIYNILAFLREGVLSSKLLSIKLISGADWTLSVSEMLLCLALCLFFIEIFKATRTSTASIIDHILSLGVFLICLVEFGVFPQFGNTTFFIIMLICLLDVVAGFTITISTARRDFGVGAHAVSGH
jgi:hypothetical protein